MRKELFETEAEQSEVVLCENCKDTIYQCDGCKEYLIPGMKIYCDEDTKHYCEDCGKEQQ